MRRDLDGHSRYGELVGRRVRTFDPGERSIEVSYEAREEFTNRIGTVSGGMLAAMLDSVTGLAALASLPGDLTAVHTMLKVEYLRPVRPGPITGRARVVERSDRNVRADGELLDAVGTVLARGEATLRVRPKRRS